MIPNTLVQPRRLLTKNLTPGVTFFDKERTFTVEGAEYRELNPGQSKLGAAIMKGCQQFGLSEGCTVLYLGASHGYTPSFVSDMIGATGTLFCVEFAPRVARDLVFVCEQRENMIPVLGDANQPAEYAGKISRVDCLFQDIAQRAQVDIFLKNFQFLKSGGFAMLALKARSIDVTRKPKDIFREIRAEFENRSDLVIVDYRELAPFEKDNAFFVVKKR